MEKPDTRGRGSRRSKGNESLTSYRIFEIRQALRFMYSCRTNFSTYDHRHQRTGHPVRSAIHKLVIGRLVVGSVTTSESLLLYVRYFFLAFSGGIGVTPFLGLLIRSGRAFLYKIVTTLFDDEESTLIVEGFSTPEISDVRGDKQSNHHKWQTIAV